MDDETNPWNELCEDGEWDDAGHPAAEDLLARIRRTFHACDVLNATEAITEAECTRYLFGTE